VFLTGTNLLATSVLPSRAEISRLNFVHPGHSGRLIGYGRQTWHSDPVPLETPADLKADLPKDELPMTAFVTVHIEPYGRVVSVTPRGATGLAPNVLDTVSRQLKRLKFFPAIEGGYAVDSDLILMLVFRPEGALPVHQCFIGQTGNYPKTFAIVTMDPSPDTPGHWLVSYGGFPASGKFPINQLDDLRGKTTIGSPGSRKTP
jgi:hypothetical protein